MSWLTKLAMKKRWLTFLVVAIVTGISVWSLFSLQMELIPDIELPITSVITIYPQAKPEVVMDEVAIEVEGVISGMKGLNQLVSTVSEGSAFTFAVFEFGTDMTETNRVIKEGLAALELPDAVRELPLLLPELEQNPQLFAIDINILPIVMFSLRGDLSSEQLQQIATADIVPALANIDGVYHVTVEGGSDQQVIVELDPGLLNNARLSLSSVAAFMTGETYGSIEEIEDMTLGARQVRLGDIGTVKLGLPSGSSVSRTNGMTSVSISIMKDGDANTVAVAKTVMDKIEQIKTQLPDGVLLSTVLDQSVYIETSVSDLTRDALIGCGLAIVVVFLFLMAFRASLVTAVSIPLSIIIGFLIMRFFGITINLLTLSAMAISVGRVIDNSIVVLEVIFRRIQHGEPFRTAAIEGVKEVATPIVSSTVATVIIFVPLAFAGGIVGELFIPFALTMTAALAASLLIALMVIPPLSNFTVRKKATNNQTWYQRLYTKALEWTLSHRAITVIIALLLFIGSLALLPVLGTSFIPDMGEKMLTVEVVVPGSTDMMETLEAAIKTEQVLLLHPYVETIQTTIGGGAGMMAGASAMMGAGGETTANIMVILASEADMEETADELREQFKDIVSEAEITVATGQAMAAAMMGTGVDISIRGDRYEDLTSIGKELFEKLEDVGGITDLELQLARTEPSLDIIPNPAMIMAAGLSMEQMAGLQEEFFFMQTGGRVARATLNGDQLDVYLNGIIHKLDRAETARALVIGFPDSIRLGEIAVVALGEQQTNIMRINGKLATSITGSITAKDIGSVNRAIQMKIDDLSLPAGVEVTQGGTMEMMEESFSSMMVAIALAVLLAYAVIAITFRSLLTPIVIMISLPLASIGALLALLLAGQTLGVFAMMGVLMLVGIVLTNAIVLIDLVERLRRKGFNIRDALLESGSTRMRPILMTALTTMIAMLPLALGLGEGAVVSSELAIVVIGGLFSSTLLTLLVIPAIYSLFKRDKPQKNESAQKA